MLAVHLVLLVSNDFPFVRAASRVYDNSLVMGIIPIVAAAGWRWWPYMILMPITLIPIAGKTVREVARAKGVLPEAELNSTLDPAAMTAPGAKGEGGG